MGTWKVSVGHACGYDSAPIPKGLPAYEISINGAPCGRYRCADHAPCALTPADRDALIEQQEQAAVAEASRELTPAQALHQTTARIPARQPKSFASLGDLADRFDPKMAAAGEDR